MRTIDSSKRSYNAPFNMSRAGVASPLFAVDTAGGFSVLHLCSGPYTDFVRVTSKRGREGGKEGSTPITIERVIDHSANLRIFAVYSGTATKFPSAFQRGTDLGVSIDLAIFQVKERPALRRRTDARVLLSGVSAGSSRATSSAKKLSELGWRGYSFVEKSCVESDAGRPRTFDARTPRERTEEWKLGHRRNAHGRFDRVPRVSPTERKRVLRRKGYRAITFRFSLRFDTRPSSTKITFRSEGGKGSGAGRMIKLKANRSNSVNDEWRVGSLALLQRASCKRKLSPLVVPRRHVSRCLALP